MKSSLPTFAAYWLILAFCPAHAADPVDQLVAKAQREFDILAPSLQKAADELLKTVRTAAQESQGEVGLTWRTEDLEPLPFVGPDGQKSALFTKTRYALTATGRAYRYKMGRVRRIYRTGVRETPFAGEVEIAVTTFVRKAGRQVEVPIEPPPGYRLAEQDAPGDLPMLPLRQVPGEALGGCHMGYPLPCEPPWTGPIQGLPKKARALSDQLSAECRKAKPTARTDTYLVAFRYSAADKKWVWLAEQKKTKPNRPP